MAETNTGRRKTLAKLLNHLCFGLRGLVFTLPALFIGGLTKSGEGCRCSSQLAEGQELLWEHGVGAGGHGARPETGVLLSSRKVALRQLLEPLDSFQ